MIEQKATAVTEEGEPTGFEAEPGFFEQLVPDGETRLVVSVPVALLPKVHRALVDVMGGPMGILFRQHIDRESPRPEGAPPLDHVSLGQPKTNVMSALVRFDGLLYHDARGEFWVRGQNGDSVILDTDGLVFCYPDDLGFRDALKAQGIPSKEVTTVRDQDYVKHWFHAKYDVQETGLVNALGLAEMASR
jgi:hypothetical protein